MRRTLPWLAIVAVLAGTVYQLRSHGRLWWCSCDYLLLWSGDILVCGLGFVLARRLGLRRALGVFVVTEIALAIWIRDNLSLNVLMLIYPIDAIKEWQAAAH
jgi:Protein of unknown function (DUF2585)